MRGHLYNQPHSSPQSHLTHTISVMVLHLKSFYCSSQSYYSFIVPLTSNLSQPCHATLTLAPSSLPCLHHQRASKLAEKNTDFSK